MKVLVTGCAGYIGSTLVGNLLSKGHFVIGVDNLWYGNGASLLPYLGDKDFVFYKGDVTDVDLMMPLLKHPDAVIHLAAVVGAPVCKKYPKFALATNELATRYIAQNLGSHQRLLYANTESVYGATDGKRSLSETDPISPLTIYGETKAAGEKAVLDHPRGFAFRFATACGASPRMRLDLLPHDFTAQLLRTKAGAEGPLKIFEGNFQRNFCHVRDIARAFCWALEKPTLVGPYNCGHPASHCSKWELAHKVADIIGLDHSNIVAGEGQDPDKRNYRVNCAKWLDTGFKFEYTLEDAIREVKTLYQSLSLNPNLLAAMRNV
jgi:nucleoside-diphosphate-sugar epimerase